MNGRAVYILMVRAQSERIAVEDLRESGFDAYAPLCRRWTRSATGKRVKLEQALLPRYVFLWSDDVERDFDKVRHARRVTGVLGDSAGKPKVLAGQWRQWLVGLVIAEAFGALDYTCKAKPKRHVGQQVRLLQGAFKGVVGTLLVIGERVSRVRLEGRHAYGEKDFDNEALEDVVAPPAKAAA